MRWLGCWSPRPTASCCAAASSSIPATRGRGYERGRLRLVYEANPLAFLVEQAGGARRTASPASSTSRPRALHQRVPLIFGSRDKVERVVALHMAGVPQRRSSAPLFGARGLFRS